ncbi:lipid droplet assembly factor 1-like isoform 2-T2 [Pholidichthys leucotaenia]
MLNPASSTSSSWIYLCQPALWWCPSALLPLLSSVSWDVCAGERSMDAATRGSRRSRSRSRTELQQLWGRWTTMLERLRDDPKVAPVLNTGIGQYLISQPFLALAVLLFSAIAALPVGIFLTFALVTIIMSVVGFVFFEAFLLFIGGLSLLCVLIGIALFSVLASVIINAVYATIFNLLGRYYPHLTKQGSVQEKETEIEGSRQKVA